MIRMAVALTFFILWTASLAQGEASRIYGNVKDAITTIEAYRGQSTGFVIGDGTILLTVAHSFSGEPLSSVSTTLSGVKLVSVYAHDASRDVIALRLNRAAPKRLTLASKTPGPGTKIYVIGTPLGYLHHTISEGIVSGVRKTAAGDLLQITAPVSPGSSGSPVLNSSGQVVGMVVGTIGEGQQLNFAVPVTEIRKVLASPIRTVQKTEMTREQRIRDLISKLGGKYGDEAARKLAEMGAVKELHKAASSRNPTVRKRALNGITYFAENMIRGENRPPQRAQTSVRSEINPIDDAEMIYIPAGEFIRGSEDDSDSRPVRRIHLDGYWIYKYEVTVAQYREFCRATRKEMPTAPSWGWIEDHPMVNVSWDDAMAYARWAGGSLPTEAQWEKAARGTDGRVYPWGNAWDASKCHCSKRELGDAGGTAPVGSYPSGVMDMAGNVWEWCSDWYDRDYYSVAPSRNPENTQMSTDRYRVLRGGSWLDFDPNDFRCAYRDFFLDLGFDFRGFRVVR